MLAARCNVGDGPKPIQNKQRVTNWYRETCRCKDHHCVTTQCLVGSGDQCVITATPDYVRLGLQKLTTD